jgi:HK97 family phage major capsid protein
MPTYNAAIARTGTLGTNTDPLVPEPMIASVIQEATQNSAALSQFRQVTMAAGTTRQPVLSVLPTAYWVTGDTGLKQTTAVEWDNVDLVAEEVATIIPVPEAYIADSGIPIWNEVRPLIGQAIGTLVDQATIFGTGAPSTFGDSVFEVADAVGNVVTAGAGDDLGVDVAALGQLLAEQGFALSGFLSKPGFQWQLVGLRSADGVPIYQSSLSGGVTTGLYGRPLNEVANGAWSSNDAVLIGGDFSKAIVGIRQDISVKIFDQGVISDGSGNVVLNLMQQDSVAMRVTARFAFATANPVTALEDSALARAPFAYLAPGT